MATNEEVLAVLETLRNAYEHEPTEAQARMYLDALAEVDAAVLEKAALDHIDRSPFFPKINELRAAIKRVEIRRQQVSPRDLYWQAMSYFSARLKGQITDEQLESSGAWRWFRRSRRLSAPGNEQ